MYKRCLMIMADGARSDRMAIHLASGRLPHIQDALVSSGGFYEATSVFPSTTGPAYFPFLTGCYPSTVNVPGIRWLDKSRFVKPWFFPKRRRSYVGMETFWINFDMIRRIQTAFDLLPRAYNIFNSVSKGVGFRRNMTRLMRIWYWYYAHLTDRWSLVDRAACDKILKAIRRGFDFCFAVFPAIDEYSHLAGPLSPAADEAYFALDRHVGKIRDALAQKGELKDTLLWIVSDHGFTATHTHFCINEFLEARGIRTFFYPLILKKGCVAANMMSGNGMTHLYFRNPNGWDKPMDAALLEDMYGTMIDDLVKEPAVDICAVKGKNGGILVMSRRGKAELQLNGSLLSYQVLTADPFGYGPLPKILSSSEAQRLTIGTEYPDGLYQLAQLFLSPRTGDIVLSAAPGYDFRKDYEKPEHFGTHGGLYRDQMLIPVICNARLSRQTLRSADVFPTMLRLMGHDIPLEIDGVSIVRG